MTNEITGWVGCCRNADWLRGHLLFVRERLKELKEPETLRGPVQPDQTFLPPQEHAQRRFLLPSEMVATLQTKQPEPVRPVDGLTDGEGI
jgi:hypothetical protein